MEKISEHISYNEAVYSKTAIDNSIDNTPTADILQSMKDVANHCFEPIRVWYGKAIRVNSFFRCLLLNRAVGGSDTSDHPKGRAIDLDAGSRAENKKIFEWAKANLIFDQLIYEKGDDTGPEWVHISFRKGANRNQVIKISK